MEYGSPRYIVKNLFNAQQQLSMYKITPWETRFSLESGFHAYWFFKDYGLEFNMELDWDEELIWKWGPISLVRIKSETEMEEQIDEEESLERELCRYVAWHDAC